MKNILITGCSSGIGLQTALTLKENNYKVYASARKDEDVEMLRNLGFETFKIDVRNKEEITNVNKKFLDFFGILDFDKFVSSKKNIFDFFEEEFGFISKEQLNKQESWIKYIKNFNRTLSTKNFILKVFLSFTLDTFSDFAMCEK